MALHITVSLGDLTDVGGVISLPAKHATVTKPTAIGAELARHLNIAATPQALLDYIVEGLTREFKQGRRREYDEGAAAVNSQAKSDWGS